MKVLKIIGYVAALLINIFAFICLIGECETFAEFFITKLIAFCVFASDFIVLRDTRVFFSEDEEKEHRI